MRTRILLSTALALTAITSCDGSLGANQRCGSTPEVGGQPLRRLSSDQVHNAITRLVGPIVGTTLVARSRFPETHVTSGFRSDANANTVSSTAAFAINTYAEDLADYLRTNAAATVPELFPCGLDASFTDQDIDNCIDAFTDVFGRRAFRRPMTDVEIALVSNLYDSLRQEQAAVDAWSGVVQYFLQAPQFLYRIEQPATVEGCSGRVTGFEMASRLSFLLENAPPDDALLDVAASGGLERRQDIAATADNLIGEHLPDMVSSFLYDYLQLYRIRERSDLSATLRSDLAIENDVWVRAMMSANPDLSVETMFTSDQVALVSNEIANIYGVDPTEGANGQLVSVPGRRGPWTHAAFLNAFGKEDRSDPIHRGLFVLNNGLCQIVAPPPADLDLNAPLQSTANAPTVRERMAPQVENQLCAGCHTQFNYYGYALENFDGDGRYRDTENGALIDASGNITTTLDANGPFSNGAELIAQVVNSEDFRDCFAENLLHYALGRSVLPEDAPSVRALVDQWATSSGSVRALAIGLTQTDAFLNRRPQP